MSLLESDRCVKVSARKRASQMKRRQQWYQHQDTEDWGTDDSDWDYSDEETRSKRRKSSKHHFIISPTSGGRSVGIIHTWTQGHGVYVV
jgi:hypothetical protein